MRLYTLGYEKRTISEFITLLNKSDVTLLIDVRETAWSYKRDFCKTKLSEHLRNVGIEYAHFKSLGNPKKIRKTNLSNADILTTYKTYLEDTNSGILELFSLFNYARIESKNICLTCFERDSNYCHRSIITSHIKPILKEIDIIHL
jgi:uncharacterized protein (DUF488 family)